MKPICFLFLSLTRMNPCLKQSDLEKSLQNDSLYWSSSICKAEMFVRDVCDEDFTSSPSFISLAATATTSVPSL